MSNKPTKVLVHDELYNEKYYKENCGGMPYERSEHWIKFFGGIAHRIANDFKPTSTLDAGCAIGLLVEALLKKNIEAVGFDISEWAIKQMPNEYRNYVKTGSILDPQIVDRKFDLITCIEVLEHLQPFEADIAIQNLCNWGDIIIFSSSPDDFKESTHFNVQQPGYWAEKFLQNGFVRVLDYDASYIASWAQVFRRESLILPALIHQYEDKLWSKTNQIHSQQQQLVKFEYDLNKQDNDVQWFKSEFNRLIKEIEAKEYKAIELDSRYQVLKQELEESLKTKSNLLIEFKGLQSSFTGIQNEYENIQNEYKDFQNKYKNLQKLCSDLQGQLTDLNQSNAELFNENQQILDHLQAANELNENIINTKSWKAVNFWWENKQKAISWVPQKKARLSVLKNSSLNIWRYQGSRELLHRLYRFAKGERRNNFISSPPVKKINDLIQEAFNNESTYDQWIKQNEPDQAALDVQRNIEQEFAYRPLISILTPVYNTNEVMLTEMFESVLNQTYSNWELCVVDGCSTKSHVLEILEKYVQRDSRIKIKYLDTNYGISGNSNEALQIITGEFTVLLDHDDKLAPNALFEVVRELNKNSSLDFIYSDKDTISEDGSQRINPLFKPQWSPDILFNTNYLTHMNVIRTKILHDIGGFDAKTDGAQDWDLFARVALKTQRIQHLPHILYHWRFHQESVASGLQAKPYAAKGQINTIKKYLKEKNIDAKVEFCEHSTPKIVWKLNPTLPISIIIDLTSQNISYIDTLLEQCFSQVLYTEVEILILNRTGEQIDSCITEKKVKILDFLPAAPAGQAYQSAVENTAGQVLLFLAADLTTRDMGKTIHELVSWTQYNEIGVVGGLLMSSDGTVASTGLILDSDGYAKEFGSGLRVFESTPLGHLVWYRNFSAIPHHCMAVKRDVINSVDGFNRNLDSTFHIDFCLRISALKLRHFYTPHAVLEFQQESIGNWDNKPSIEEFEKLKILHKTFFQGTDPYFNPHLTFINEKMDLQINKENVIPQTEKANTQSIPPSAWDMYSQDAAGLSTWLDVSNKALQKNRKLNDSNSDYIDIKSITWFLPEFQNAFYGGIHTILRFAAYFKDKHEIKNRFVIVGNSNSKQIQNLIVEAFPSLSNAEVEIITELNSVASLPKTDAAICTLWSTAYYQIHFNQTRRKFYFIQDYEPTFYPAGSTSGQVEATYRFGFYGITNTISLKTIYERDYEGKAVHFVPSTNSKVFYPPKHHRLEDKPYRVFFYVRPGHPRNAFELGMAALRILKSKMRNDIEIITAGSNWNPEEYGLEEIIKNYGLLKYEETGELYRSCHAGMAMMFTRHPSYIPFELMACKSLVITNYNSSTSWLFKNGENCLLSEASATAIAETVEEGLCNVKLRQKITENAYRLIEENHYDWNSQIEKIYQDMCASKS